MCTIPPIKGNTDMKKVREIKVKATPNNYMSLLGCVLVLLKVLEVGSVATMSWWFVLLPFYLGLVIVAAMAIGLCAIGAAIYVGAFLWIGILAVADTVTDYLRK